MSTEPAKSLWEAYLFMLEKAPTNTVLFTGIVLILLASLLLFLVLSASAGLRELLRDLIKGLRYSDGKLAYDGSPKSGEAEVETDEKGNVKPPTSQREPEATQPNMEHDQFYWLI